LKRRDFLTLSSLSGLGVAASTHYLRFQKTLASTSQVQPVRSQPLLRFVALGDTGIGNEGQYAIAKAMTRYLQSNPFSLVLLNGDLIYDNGEIEKISSVFEKPYTELLQQNVRFQAVLGNHDIRTKNGADHLRYPGFNMQGRYYTFTQASVQFFALDTNSNAPWDAQIKWLDDQLARIPSRWKIVFGHHPLYSSGLHGGDKELAERLAPLFSRHGVQLYLCGHDHNYERTQPIDKTTYLVCGAGSNPRPVGKSVWTVLAKDDLSFAAIEVYENRIEIKGIDADGQIFDRGSVWRSPRSQKV
jgi:Icc-related predicted phosphoesterase